MPAALVVKNTFLCLEDDEAPSSPMQGRRRAATADDASLGRPCPPSSAVGEGGTVPDLAEARPCAAAAGGDRGPSSTASLAVDLRAGGAAALAALDEICRTVRCLAFGAAGSALVLEAFEVSRAEEVRRLALGLRGAVGEAACSSCAGPVLEQVVRRLSLEDAAFVAEELLARDPLALAKSESACSVLCRLLESSPGVAGTVALVDAVLSEDVALLCSHKFGHEVAMSVLSNGTSRQRGRVLCALGRDLQRFARHRFASRVLEQALALGSEAERDSLASQLLAHPGTAVALACHTFGVHVARELLQVPSASQQVTAWLLDSSAKVRRDKFGSGLLRELEAGKLRPSAVLHPTREHCLEGQAMYGIYLAAFAVHGA